MARGLLALLLAIAYPAMSAFAEIEETDAAVEEFVDDLQFRARRSSVPGWGVAVAVGLVTTTAVVSRFRRGGGDEPSAGDDGIDSPSPSPAVANAPRWTPDTREDSDTRVTLLFRNVGDRTAHHVRTSGLVDGRAIPGIATDGARVAPGEIFEVALTSRPSRLAFYLAYLDDAGFKWWCFVDYRPLVRPPVAIGRAERDFHPAVPPPDRDPV